MSFYTDELMDIYREGRNKGVLVERTHESRALNSLCGDEAILHVLISDGIIIDTKFSGDSCAISSVYSSLLLDKIKGMSLAQLNELSGDDVLDLVDVKLSPSRIRCALLSLHALKILKEIQK